MEAVLTATRRDQFGKNEAGRIRRGGQIPAVLYGGGSPGGEALAVDPAALLRILHSQGGVNTLIALKLDGASDTRVLVKEYQLDPVGHKLLHADFYRVAMDKVLQITVPIHLTGEAKGIKAQGGVVDFVHREIEIECLPADIPDKITVDVTEMMVGEGVRVRDVVPADRKWTAVSDPDTLIVHVVLPRAEAVAAATDETAAAAAAAPTAPAEPEVMKKGKGDKAEEDKAAKDKPAKDKPAAKPAKEEGKKK